MNIKHGYKLHELGEENIAIPIGEEAIAFHGMIRLNETGALLWRKLEQGATPQSLVEEMMAAYQVDASTVQTDVETFVSLLHQYHLLAQ